MHSQRHSSLYKLYIYKIYYDTCLGDSSSIGRLSGWFKSYNGDKAFDIYDYKVCYLITRGVNYLNATRLKIKLTPTWSCSFSPFNFSARQRILSCNQNNTQRGSWALVLDHPMLFADHRLKILSSWFWSTANNKDTTRPAAPWCPCWSPWSPWTCWPAPPTSPEVQLSNLLIDNWAFLKSHYSEGNLLLQPCLNYNCQTYATTEWYWKIFRCVGISL